MGTFFVYAIKPNGVLFPAYHSENLKSEGFANRGHQLVTVKPVLEKVNPGGPGSEDRKFWLVGAKKIVVDLGVELEWGFSSDENEVEEN